MSRKDDAAEMLMDGDPVPMVAAATGLQETTVAFIAQRLDTPVGGDSTFTGAGVLRCRGCGRPYTQHTIRRTCPSIRSRY